MSSNRNARLAYIARRAAAMPIVVVVVVVMSSSAYANGNALPPGARPHGTSRAQMAQALAPFTFSGNNSTFLPETPFQVLYGDPATIAFTPDGSGLVESGSNAFTVQAGMSFFVPVFNVDDSPPVLGTFPTTTAGAQQYLFDPAQLGGRDFQIVVDGTTTSLGPSYVAGPVTTPALPDGGGTHAVTLGAFLSPLTSGTHTVTISGGIFGALVPTIGVDFLRISFTYQITVVP